MYKITKKKQCTREYTRYKREEVLKMNKKGLLGKSHSENKDEREEQVRYKSIKWAGTTMVLLSGVFAVIRGCKGENILDLLVVICGSVSVIHLYRYLKLKNKEYLVLGIMTLCTAIFCLIMYYIGL